MKVTEMTNLYVAHNDVEDFTILICATDETDAKDKAIEYACDTGMAPYGIWTISDLADDSNFNCDYVIY